MEKEVGLDPVKLGQPAFGGGPEGFNPVDVNSVAGELVLAVVDSKVLVKADVHQTVIAAPGVGVDGAGEINFARNDGPQGAAFTVRENLGVDPTSSFKDPKDRLAVSASATVGRHTFDVFRTKVALIHLHLTDKLSQLGHLLGVD